MTQEEKDLLFKNLCARLPYHPKFQLYYEEKFGSGIFDENLWEIDGDGQHCNSSRRLEDIKPYLRLMSSMTEEEKKEYYDLLSRYDASCFISRIGSRLFDWLNSHHFDYRGLIQMGLALEASEGMYNN